MKGDERVAASVEDRDQLAVREISERGHRGQLLVDRLDLTVDEPRERDPQSAKSMIGDAPLPSGADAVEASVWIGLARTLLNLDEFITRE